MKKISMLFALLIFTAAGIAEAQTLGSFHAVVWEQGTSLNVVKQWTSSLNKLSKISSTTYIVKKSGGQDSLHRNKHRNLILWVPESTDLEKDFKLVIWLHGHYGYFPSRTFEDRTLKQFLPHVGSKNFVLAIPEMPWSVNTSTPTKRNSLLWTKQGEFISFKTQLETLLIKHVSAGAKDATRSKKKLGEIDYRVVGHSAGGSAIKRLAITGDLCELNPSMVVWSDSSYGLWLRQAWDGCLKDHRDILVKVFVAKGDTPWRRATQFMGQFQGPVDNLELHVKRKPRWSHKLIGDNVVGLSGVLE